MKQQKITIGLLITIIGLLVTAIVILQTRTFDTPEDKYRTKYLVNSIDSETVKNLSNHVGGDIHMTMKTKDSLFVTQREMDSVLNNYVLILIDDVNELNTKLWVQGQALKRIEKKVDNN